MELAANTHAALNQSSSWFAVAGSKYHLLRLVWPFYAPKGKDKIKYQDLSQEIIKNLF